MNDEERAQAARQRWLAASHAMQSGVAMKMGISVNETTPKHLRVGINAAMSDMGGLVKLLIAKGVFTEAEYFEAIADQMEAEQHAYETELSKHFQHEIKLG